MSPRRKGSPRIRVGVDIVAVERLTRPAAGDEGILPTLFIKGELACCEGKRRQDERNWWHASRRRKRG